MLKILKEEVFDWLQKNKCKGYDPFDGLTTPLLHSFVEGSLKKFKISRFIRLFFLQLMKRFPWNVRPLFGIRPQENAMTWAAVILGSVEAYQRGEAHKKDFIQKALDRMLRLQTEKTHLWGYPFPWASKAFYLKAYEPNLVLSAFCLRALAKVILTWPHETESQKWRAQYQQSTASLYKNFYKEEVGYFSYISKSSILVHNANLFGVEAMSGCSPLQIQLSSEQKNRIEKALQKTLAAQEPSGRWPYGSEPHHQWCDNFHTAYNLMALANIHSIFKEETIALSIRTGLQFYLKNAFTEDGKPRYYDNQTYPLETHSAAVALIFFNEMVKGKWVELSKAQTLSQKICETLKENFYLGNGRFIYRKGKLWTHKTVFTRWTQSFVYYGLETADKLLQQQNLTTKIDGEGKPNESLVSNQANGNHIGGPRDLF